MDGIISGVLVFIALVAVVLTENRIQKRVKMLLAIVIAALATYTLRILVSFVTPSFAAAIIFSILTAYLNKEVFKIFFLLTIVITFFEIVSGSAGIFDVAAALPIGLLSFYLVDVLSIAVRGKKADANVEVEGQKNSTSIILKEDKRQIAHIGVGFLAIILLILLSRLYFVALMFTIILLGLLLINFRFLNKKIRVIEHILGLLERENIRFPGWGSACYATGVLVIAVFLTATNAIIAGIIMLALGDGIASLIGQRGKIKLPYNNKKTFEGLFAFFISSLPACLFIGEAAVIIGLVCAIIETLPIKMDDNLSIPVTYVALYSMLL